MLCKGVYLISIFQKKRGGVYVCVWTWPATVLLSEHSFSCSSSSNAIRDPFSPLTLGLYEIGWPVPGTKGAYPPDKGNFYTTFFSSFATLLFPPLQPRQPTLLSQSARSSHERFRILIYSTSLLIDASFTFHSPLHFPSLSTSINRKDIAVSLHPLSSNELAPQSLSLT